MKTAKLLAVSVLGAAIISSPAVAEAKKDKGPLATVSNAKFAEDGTAGNSGKVPPGKCVSEIAKPHSGYGISDEIKDKCAIPPVSK